MGISTGELLSEKSKGKDVRTSNIVAAQAVANAIRTSLGPRGMDKLLQLPNNKVMISNDGATILKNMKVVHPAAKLLVELAQAQDVQAGDGTTSVVVLAGALLQASEALLNNKGLHPMQIANAFINGANYACKVWQDNAQRVDLHDRESLLQAVETCLSSKVVASSHTSGTGVDGAVEDIFCPLAVDSVLALLGEERKETNVDLNDIRILEQLGGTIEDSQLIVNGLVLEKGASKTAGGPSSVKDAKILLIQYCLSAPKTDMDNQVVVSDYAAMDRLLKQERQYILNLCKDIKKTGANVLLIQKSILRDAYNELSLHFLAKMKILVITDVERSDIDYLSRTLHCQPVAHPEQLSASKLGTCENVTDVFLEGASTKVVKFSGIQPLSDTTKQQPTVTVLLRGSNQLVLSESARALHDAQCVVRSLIQQPFLLAGGGAPEIMAAQALRQYALSNECSGVDAACINAMADALEVIPFTLAENAGLQPLQVVTELRAKHAAATAAGSNNGSKSGAAGIQVAQRRPAVASDMYQQRVVQPLRVSTSALTLATETVAMILKVDDLIVVQ